MRARMITGLSGLPPPPQASGPLQGHSGVPWLPQVVDPFNYFFPAHRTHGRFHAIGQLQSAKALQRVVVQFDLTPGQIFGNFCRGAAKAGDD